MADKNIRKVVIIGDESVGKTSIIHRYVSGAQYNGKPTHGADESKKTLHLQTRDQHITFYMWDLSGQPRFKTLSGMYFRDTDGIVLVYDITNQASFDNLTSWMEEIEEKAPSGISMIILGNKKDLAAQEVVSLDKAN